MEPLPELPGRDPWGLPIVLPDLPALDAELGLTTTEDGAWDASPPGLSLGQFLTQIGWGTTFFSIGWLRYLGAKTGLHRRPPRGKDLL